LSENKKIRLFLKNILKDLNSLKAVDTKLIDIKNRSALGDFLIITSGNSSRHINAIASKVIENNKKKIISVEGLRSTEWVIVDFGDIILNIFKPEAREYYCLEKIWQPDLEDEKISFG
jgi:ribosome-associated protein|tara:strand:+ start:4125 stop:4478 length:354 start_codon:yes stop_codon:yes gene_type:complete